MLLRHVLSILILPFTVTVVIPVLLMRGGTGEAPLLLRTVAVLLFASGLTLAVTTIGQFMAHGRGTLAPWDPTRQLVVTGVYRHVRNPMITGVFLILVAECLWFASVRVAIWAGVFMTINAIFIPLVEEKGLVRRFGAGYELYRRNVPGWLPRFTAWDGTESGSER